MPPPAQLRAAAGIRLRRSHGPCMPTLPASRSFCLQGERASNAWPCVARTNSCVIYHTPADRHLCLQARLDAGIRAHAGAHIHTGRRAHKNTGRHVHTTRVHAHASTHAYARKHAHAYAHAHAHTRANACRSIQTRMPACTHTRTHARTHTRNH